MKYTRQIVSDIKSSAPSFEAAVYDSIPEGDSSDESVLALEAVAYEVEINGQLDESGQVEDKIDRLDTLTTYVETQVNDQETAITPNELALIEQTVDATLDGTGEEVDTVMPALESALGTTSVSLESVKETIGNFFKAAEELVTGAASSFGKFIKGMFSRNAALKNRVEKLEKRLSSAESVESTVTLTEAQSVSAAFEGNSILTNFGAIVKGGVSVSDKLAEIQGPYCTQLITLHDKFVKDFIKVWEDLNRRKDEYARDGVGAEISADLKKLNDLNAKTFKDGKSFGGLYTDFTPVAAKENFGEYTKAMVKGSPNFGHAGNVTGKNTEVTGITKELIGQLIRNVKSSITNLQKFKQTDTMWAIDWLSGTQDAVGGLIRLTINGLSYSAFMNSINRTNRTYVACYTRPVTAYVNHFFRVANAQLGLAEKAVK